MLAEVLSEKDCAKCEFCCSFRRASLDLTPCFDKENIEEIMRLYPEAKFKTRSDGAVTIDLDDKYETDDVSEEALCYFNRKGCILPSHLKPFDCSLWPFRLMKNGDGLSIALVPSCPYIDKSDLTKLKKAAENVGKAAIEYSKDHPEIIIEYRDDYSVLCDLPG